jgi:hypothetical protein
MAEPEEQPGDGDTDEEFTTEDDERSNEVACEIGY